MIPKGTKVRFREGRGVQEGEFVGYNKAGVAKVRARRKYPQKNGSKAAGTVYTALRSPDLLELVA